MRVPRLARAGLPLGPLAFLAVLLWPDLPLDGAQRRVAAVTAWTATWWITAALPIAMTSLLPAVLLPVLGVLGARAVAPLYMQDLILLFLGAFVVALGLERWGVHRRIALWIIARVGTRPRRLVLGFMLASSFLSLWINNTSTTLLMLPIGTAVIASMGEGEEKGRRAFATALLLGMAYSSSVGGMGTPVGTAPNQVFLGVLRELFPEAPEIGFGAWMLAWLPLILLYLPLGWFLLTRVALRVPAETPVRGEAIHEERRRQGPMGRAQKRMAAVFLVTALLWVTRVDVRVGSLALPGWVGLVLPERIESPEGFLTDATVALVMALACFLVPSGERRGERLMDWTTAKRLPWDVLLLIGGGFAIAGAFQESGLDERLGAGVAALFAGRPEWLVVAAICVFVATLTEITSNTATTAVLLPVLGRAGVDAGFSPLLTMVPATIAASAAFMLPVATPPNAVVFSAGHVTAPTMARVGIWMNVLLALLVTVLFQAWGRGVLGI